MGRLFRTPISWHKISLNGTEGEEKVLVVKTFCARTPASSSPAMPHLTDPVSGHKDVTDPNVFMEINLAQASLILGVSWCGRDAYNFKSSPQFTVASSGNTEIFPYHDKFLRNLFPFPQRKKQSTIQIKSVCYILTPSLQLVGTENNLVLCFFVMLLTKTSKGKLFLKYLFLET